jgi:glucose/arabinose dehydrogenase
MQAHSAPLGLTFYNYQAVRPNECDGVIPFPPEMDGFVFIAFHGSWNRVVPTGYKVVYVPTTSDGDVDGGMNAVPIDLLRHSGPGAEWVDGFRPVDVSFDDCGRLLVSSDGSGGSGAKVIRIESTSTAYIVPPELEWRGPIRRIFGTFTGIFFRMVSTIRSFFR